MAAMLPLLLALLAAAGHAAPQPQEGCSVDVRKSEQPLLLKPGGSRDVHGFVTPDPSGKIVLRKDEKIIVACPNNSIETIGQSQAIATCVSGSTFSINGMPRVFANLACKSQPAPSERKADAKCGSKREYQVIQLGFVVGSDFYTLIDACFDVRSYRTVYDHFTMVAEIGGSQKGFPRPKWLSGRFFRYIDMDKQYRRTTQIKTVGELLGDPKLGFKYISEKNDYFLSRGHLAAKSDFCLGAQEYVTFFYMNAAPQWQTFNGGNWQTMEEKVQSYAARNHVELQIYTGTHDITTLPNVKGVQTKLYLYINDTNDSYYIPVPKLFWRIVHKVDTEQAVVFLGVNNPYNDRPENICHDVCPKISWIKWNADDKTLGYSYCCEYADFKNAVADAPDLKNVKYLLT